MRPLPGRLASLFVLSLTAALAACDARDDERPAAADTTVAAEVAAPPSDASRQEAGVGTVITTTNGAVSMALVEDRIVVRLSDSLVGQVRSKFDSGAARDTGSLGGLIARMAKSAVTEALGTPVAYPLEEIEDATYDGEAIRFRFRDGSKRVIESTKVDDRPLLASFAPDDARRFVEAVRAAKGRRAEVR